MRAAGAPGSTARPRPPRLAPGFCFPLPPAAPNATPTLLGAHITPGAPQATAVGTKETEAVNFLEKKVRAMPAEGASYDDTCQTAISALQVWGRGSARRPHLGLLGWRCSCLAWEGGRRGSRTDRAERAASMRQACVGAPGCGGRVARAPAVRHVAAAGIRGRWQESILQAAPLGAPAPFYWLAPLLLPVSPHLHAHTPARLHPFCSRLSILHLSPPRQIPSSTPELTPWLKTLPTHPSPSLLKTSRPAKSRSGSRAQAGTVSMHLLGQGGDKASPVHTCTCNATAGG